MKTSNKILIIFTLAFFGIPFLGMVAVSKIYYKPRTQNDWLTDQRLNNLPLKTKSANKKTILLNQPFQSVNIVNGNRSIVEFHFIKDKDYGAKIDKDLSQYFDLKVIDQVLNIRLKDGISIDEYGSRLMIVVYAPELKAFEASNLEHLSLVAISDSLNIKIKNCDYLSVFDSAIKSQTNTNGDTTNIIKYNETKIKNLNVRLENTSMNLGSVNLNNLNIISDNSIVELTNQSIQSLNIKTSGRGSVKLEGLNLNIAKGEFSDDTKLEIPTPLLKKFFKN